MSPHDEMQVRHSGQNLHRAPHLGAHAVYLLLLVLISSAGQDVAPFLYHIITDFPPLHLISSLREDIKAMQVSCFHQNFPLVQSLQ